MKLSAVTTVGKKELEIRPDVVPEVLQYLVKSDFKSLTIVYDDGTSNVFERD